MGNHNTAMKEYIRSVSKALPCSGKMKKHILSQLQDSITDYLEQNPDAGLAAMQEHFGTPQQITSSYVDNQDASVLLKKMSIKKKVLTIVAGVMAAILLIWIGSVAWATYQTQISTNSFITEDINQN